MKQPKLLVVNAAAVVAVVVTVAGVVGVVL